MIALHAQLQAARPDDAVVCLDGAAPMTYGAFRARVAAYAAAFANQAATRHALCVEDPFDFTCALFALLACGKHVVIPASAAPAYLESLGSAFDALVTDASLRAIEPHAEAVVGPIEPHAPITLYTSGSSGAPKPIEKTLAQFDAEVVTLEQQWGGQIGAGAVMASVPHHHIYGLLFRIFWLGAPRWLYTAMYVAMGWAAVWWMPAFWANGGPLIVGLIVAGGLVYSFGALVYARKLPNPSPTWFGFHEIFHACTVVAAICHFVAIALVTLR